MEKTLTLLKSNKEYDYYSFVNRKSGHIFYSRHKKPDFVTGLSDEQIAGEYLIKGKTKEEIEENEIVFWS